MSGSRARRGGYRANPALAILSNPPTLAREVHELRYTHADDGRAYKHVFGPGVRAKLNRDGSVTLRHAKGSPLWEEFPERPYLVNPRGKTMARAVKKSAKKSHRRAKRSPPKGFRSWGAYMASIRPGSKKSTPSKEGRSMARKHKKRARHTASRAHAPARRHARRRSYRHNPGATGLLPMLMQGVMDAGQIVLGKAAVRALPALLKLPSEGAIGIGIQAATAVGLGFAAEKVKRGAGRMVTAGALAAPIESFVKSLNVPILSTALGDYEFGEVDQLGEVVGTLGGYPQAALAAGGIGDAESGYAGYPAYAMQQ